MERQVAAFDRFAARLPAIDRARRSPNHNERLGPPAWPDAIVLHYTGMRDGPSAMEWLCNPASQVSCHYVVDEAGAILELVSEDRRAWCAGRSFWAGVRDLNSATINIEVINGGHDYGLPPYPDRQIEAVIALCDDIARRHGIRPERILAHSDIAPSRKRDPGEHFPWARLAAAGLGHWIEPPKPNHEPALSLGAASAHVEALQTSLSRYGYEMNATGLYDSHTETVVRAFQRHFRPALVDGIADATTRSILGELHRTLPPASSHT